ncbi:MAG: hypothetical protein ACI4EJ_05185 [Bacteroides sp.]
MNCDAPIPMTEFDMVTLDDSTQMIKALIPYLDFSIQKNMAVMVRIKELTDTIRCYSEGRIFPDRSGAGSEEIIAALGRYCPPDIRNSLNMMTQMMQFSNAMNMYKDMEQSPEFTNIMNMMNEINSHPANEASGSDNIMSDSGNPVNSDNSVNSGNSVNSSPEALLEGMMNSEQMKMYNSYLQEIDNIFSENIDNPEAKHQNDLSQSD